MINDLLPRYPKEVFIETGTKDGDTLSVAKDLFSRCYSVELDRDNWDDAVLRFAPDNHVQVMWGESKQVLPKIIDPNKSTVFYLDAHYEGGELLYQKPECPLMDELKVIVDTPWKEKPVVIVDDINMFHESYWNHPATNHHLFNPKEWPRLKDILGLMSGYEFREDHEHNVGIFS